MSRLLNEAAKILNAILARIRSTRESKTPPQLNANSNPAVTATAEGGATTESLVTNHVSGHSNGGGIYRGMVSQGVPLLQGFTFQYVGPIDWIPVDHHIRMIAISYDRMRPTEIRLEFSDEDQDDNYWYYINHQVVPDDPSIKLYRLHVSSDGGEIKQNIPHPEPINDYAFVLIGFSLWFADDHHIKHVGILEDQGQILISFHDASWDNNFSAELQYAYVPINKLQYLGEAWGERKKGSHEESIPGGGVPVLRGFDLEFMPYFTGGLDHHLKKVVVHVSWGKLTLNYADIDEDDGYRFLVRYGILSRDL
jgi:hypothetical protein